MGFLAGSLTFTRYEIIQDPTGDFGDSHLKKLRDRQIDQIGRCTIEEPAIGFIGGSHLFDYQFDREKNLTDSSLQFGIRIDSFALPGAIKRAWMQMEINAISQDSIGGKPTKAQREEAQQAVDQRCQDEADQGNYRRMSVVPVLWDAATETMFLGSTSEKTNDHCLGLLESTFGLEFRALSPSRLANNFCADDAEAYGRLTQLEPASFLGDSTQATVTWWNGMTDNVDYLGNEFLLWLWWKWDTGNGEMVLADESSVSGMFARSLTLDCPLGESGKESISSDAPTSLPEAALAIRMGKLPRKAGLTLVRNAEQFDLTLQAETFQINGGKISYPGETNRGGGPEDRMESVRQMAETIDLTFEAFLDRRLGATWSQDCSSIRKWLNRETATNRRQVA